MTFLQEVIRQIEEYTEKYNEEVNGDLLRQIKEQQQLTNRKNFEGHVTASCYLLSLDKKKVLQIYNKNLKKFLQPGGHCEDSDSTPFEAALRELEEETGISGNDCILLDKIPIDINTHPIPENVKKTRKRTSTPRLCLFVTVKQKDRNCLRCQ